TDAIERRQMPPKHVIETIDDGSALQRPEITDFLGYDNERPVAPRITANSAWRDRVEIGADLAGYEVARRLLHGLGERFEQLMAPLQKRERSLARRARSEPRQARQQLNQALDFRPCNPALHDAC